MTELDKLLEQSRQVAERIRVLAEEYQTLRIKYRLLNERHEGIGSSSGEPPTYERTPWTSKP